MRTYGWTEAQLNEAARILREKLKWNHHVILRDFTVIAERCRRGGLTAQFVLRFLGDTGRLHNRKNSSEPKYAPGVGVKPHTYRLYRWVTDPVPESEVNEEIAQATITPSRREIYYLQSERSIGAPCFHAFGHFFRTLFDLNPNGKIVTGINSYNGREDFEDKWHYSDIEKGSRMEPIQYSSMCYCARYGVEDF